MVEAIPALKWRLRRCLYDAEQRTVALSLGPQRHKTERESSPLCRPVENFPVAQLAACPERNRAGSDASQGEGNFSRRRASVGAKGPKSLTSPLGIGNCRPRRFGFRA